MAKNSKIEWCHHTANLWWGCTAVHSGCDNCYAETLSKRWGNDVWGNDKPRREIKSVWSELARYQKFAEAAGEMHRVFVGSMMDIAEKVMPVINSKGEISTQINTGTLRDKFYNEVVPNCPNLLFLLLTKRPSNFNKQIPASWLENPPANVMFGTSPANQATADMLIPQLLRVKGKHFLSVEPQLSEIDLSYFFPEKSIQGVSENMKELYYNHLKIDWVIQGGESGHYKRPFNTDWARKLRDQCKAAGVPYFFKQIDKVQTIPEDLKVREFPKIDY